MKVSSPAACPGEPVPQTVTPSAQGGSEIDRGVAPAGGHQQPQLGQALEEAAGKRRPLAHDADDLEVRERFGDRVLGAEMTIEHRDLDPVLERRPVGHGQRDPLIVVEDRELHR